MEGCRGGLTVVAGCIAVAAGFLGCRVGVGRSGILAGRILAVGCGFAGCILAGYSLAGRSSAGCSSGARAGLGSRRIGIVGCRGRTFCVRCLSEGLDTKITV